MPKKNLTAKEKRVLERYAVHFNGRQAAMDVKVKKANAAAFTSRLLRRQEAKDYLAEICTVAKVNDVMEKHEVMAEISKIGRANISDVLTFDGTNVKITPFAKIPKAVLAAVSEVWQTPEGVRIRMHSKTKALTDLCKHHGLFALDNQQRQITVISKDYRDAETPGFDTDGQPSNSAA